MPNRRIDSFFEMEMGRLMFNEGMMNNPTRIHDYFTNKAYEGIKEYRDYPALRTIKKYMAPIRNRSVTEFEKIKEFHYPSSIGDKDNQIPRRYAGYGLNCLMLYRKHFGLYPSIGLTERFVDVAIGTQQPKGFSDILRALIAEKLWYADLIDAIPCRKRPDTSYEELYIENHAWTQEECPEYYLNAKPLVIPNKDARFLLCLPFLGSNLNSELYKTEVKDASSYGEGTTRKTLQQECEIFPNANPLPENRNVDSFTTRWRKVTEEIMGVDIS